MIQGTFGNGDELFFEIELIAADGSVLPIDALLNKAFSSLPLTSSPPRSTLTN